MNRLFGGAVAFGLASVGALALGSPVGAQEGSEVLLDATVSPEIVAPGEDVTATSVDACTVPEAGGDLYWVAFPVAGEEPIGEGVAPLEGDGSWSVTFAAPSDPGDYEFYALCPGDLPPGEEDELEELLTEAPDELATLGDEPEGEEPPGEEPPGEEPVPVFEYYGPEYFAVASDEQPPAPNPEAPPTAAPAQPVPGEPTYTG
jgi:hypothetical protein